MSRNSMCNTLQAAVPTDAFPEEQADRTSRVAGGVIHFEHASLPERQALPGMRCHFLTAAGGSVSPTASQHAHTRDSARMASQRNCRR